MKLNIQKLKKIPVWVAFVVVCMLGLSLIVLAQVGIPNLPQTFTFTMNPLPPPQSSTQMFYGCPYDRSLEIRTVDVYQVTGSVLLPEVRLQFRYWTIDRSCAGSQSLNLSLASALSSQQLVENLNTALNLELAAEAQLNRQPRTTPPPISVGSGLGGSTGGPGTNQTGAGGV